MSQPEPVVVVASVGERQPLLAQQAQPYDVETPSAEPDAVPVQSKARWWSIAWYATLTGLGIFFAVVFIKGFIDADDVEVSNAIHANERTVTRAASSLTGTRR